MNEKKINIATLVYASICTVLATITAGPKGGAACIGISVVFWLIGRVTGRSVANLILARRSAPAPLTQRNRW